MIERLEEIQMAEYLILIYENEDGYVRGGPEAWQTAGGAHGRFAGQVGEKGGKMLGGDALQPTGTATPLPPPPRPRRRRARGPVRGDQGGARRLLPDGGQ